MAPWTLPSRSSESRWQSWRKTRSVSSDSGASLRPSFLDMDDLPVWQGHLSNRNLLLMLKPGMYAAPVSLASQLRHSSAVILGTADTSSGVLEFGYRRSSELR